MSYNDQLRKLADEFFNTFQRGGSAKEILRWAYDNNKWAPHPEDFIRAGAEQLARAMRDDSETDPQGRTVRKKHVVLEDRGGEQIPIWIDYKVASREQMELSFQYRRKQVVNDSFQLRTDVDSFNENRNMGEPIQLVLDMTDDVEEMILLGQMRKRKYARAS